MIEQRPSFGGDDAASDETVEARLGEEQLVLMTKERFTRMLQDGYPMFQYRTLIETTWTAALPERLATVLPARLGRWRPVVVDMGVLAGFAGVLLAATTTLQRRHDRR